jgi:shikimate dehydrogenase
MRLGLLGRTLGHTLSPLIHGKIFAYTGGEGSYGIFETEGEGLPDFVRTVRDTLAGFNVTIPYKTGIMQYLDGLSEEAEKIGAVNTVHVHGGRLTGYNTDYFGFGYMLRKAGISIKGKTCCILGSGGAARAVAVFLKDAGAGNITIVSRDENRAREMFPGFHTAGYAGLKGDVLVNTTPVGMSPDISGCPADATSVAAFRAVLDIVYNPKQTALLRTAGEFGLKTAGGMDMLVAQAVRSQEIWRGISIDPAVIDKIAEEM